MCYRLNPCQRLGIQAWLKSRERESPHVQTSAFRQEGVIPSHLRCPADTAAAAAAAVLSVAVASNTQKTSPNYSDHFCLDEWLAVFMFWKMSEADCHRSWKVCVCVRAHIFPSLVCAFLLTFNRAERLGLKKKNTSWFSRKSSPALIALFMLFLNREGCVTTLWAVFNFRKVTLYLTHHSN